MYSKIIAALDESEPSQRAVAAAAELAALSGGSLHLLHVRERQDVVGKGGGSFDVEYKEEADALVAAAVEKLSTTGVEVTTQVVHAPIGHVAHEIVAAAKAHGADLIVMGSHGRSALSAAVLGSNAYKVVHLADGALLVVR